MGILIFGAVFVDIKGYPLAKYIPGGRNVGRVIQTHGGVSRNVAEDIANVELRPTFVSVVDESGTGADVIDKLRRHKVNTDYIIRRPDGMGTWLAVFDNGGDVIASISKRPDLGALLEVLDRDGDRLVSEADSVVVEIDIEVPLLKRIFALAGKHHKNVYAVVSNMSIAMERRDLLQQTSCIVCNAQEAGMLFSEDYSDVPAESLQHMLVDRLVRAGIPRMVVTLGEAGAVYAEIDGMSGFCPAQKVDVIDTTGAGDAFFSGVTIGLTYGKSLAEACEIGTRLAISVISTKESVCPRFRPEEFGLSVPWEE
ncbi:MAG: carbohydrate kinase family protein [Clostridia bacterium]|nr:carbohydrate kinase family protein [Clostridia bacterium]